MKSFLTYLMFFLAVGFSLSASAIDAFDSDSAHRFCAAAEADSVSVPVQAAHDGWFSLLPDSLVSIAESILPDDFDLAPVHGQPLPGVLVSLLIGAFFGLAKLRRRLHAAKDPAIDSAQSGANSLCNTHFYLFSSITKNASPGADLFCLRE